MSAPWFDPSPGERLAIHHSTSSWIYGYGADGPLVLHDGDTLVPGFYTDVTIVAGATVTVPIALAATPAIHCSGTFTINGTMNLAGIDAVNSASVDPSGLIFGEGNTARPGIAPGYYSGPFIGGWGGEGTTGPAEVPHTDPQGRAYLQVDNSVLDPIRLLCWLPADVQSAVNGYGFATGGGGDGTFAGGAGGSGGRFFLLLARHIVHGPDSVFLIHGGNGAPGGDDGAGVTGNGDCGGGGGGAGGWWMSVSDDITGVPTVIGTGGAGGAGSGTGQAGSAGMTGRGIHYLNA